MFEYEHEVRIVLFIEDDSELSKEDILGYPIEWDPQEFLECVHIHPDADESFMKTVVAEIECYAPNLKNCVVWSAMKNLPPF
jgi:hypothetical protein